MLQQGKISWRPRRLNTLKAVTVLMPPALDLLVSWESHLHHLPPTITSKFRSVCCVLACKLHPATNFPLMRVRVYLGEMRGGGEDDSSNMASWGRGGVGRGKPQHLRCGRWEERKIRHQDTRTLGNALKRCLNLNLRVGMERRAPHENRASSWRVYPNTRYFEFAYMTLPSLMVEASGMVWLQKKSMSSRCWGYRDIFSCSM